MGSIAETVEQKIKESLKNKDSRGASVYRMVKAALVNERIAKTKELTDTEEVAVIRREMKKRQDSIESFKAADRPERVAEEEAEAAILQVLLPPELSDEDIRVIVKKVIAEQGQDQTPPSGNFGKIMGGAMKAVDGRASGERVGVLVKEELE